MKRLLLLSCLLLCMPAVVHSAKVDGSFAQISPPRTSQKKTGAVFLYQLFKCDVSGSIAGTGPLGGDSSCPAGSWSRAVDCAGASKVTVKLREYGTGSVNLSLWNVTTLTSDLDGPDVEDPASAPTSADPDPIAVNLTSGTTLDGVADPISYNVPSSSSYDNLVGRIDVCTGNCDFSAFLQCEY